MPADGAVEAEEADDAAGAEDELPALEADDEKLLADEAVLA